MGGLHLSELAKQILAFFKFYNTGQCLLRFPAIIMPGVVGFDFMKNDSGGGGLGVQINQCPRKQAMSP